MEALDSMPVEMVTLESLCMEGYPVRGRTPSEESNEGIPIIKVRNVTGQGISLDTEYAPDSDQTRQEGARAILQKGDILITSTGEGTIGRIDIWPYDDIAITDSHVSICRLQPDRNLQYVVEFLKSEYGQIQMLRHVSGSTGQTELLIDHIKTLRIPLPKPEIQDEIVRVMLEAKSQATILSENAAKLRGESANVIASARQQMLRVLSENAGLRYSGESSKS